MGFFDDLTIDKDGNKTFIGVLDDTFGTDGEYHKVYTIAEDLAKKKIADNTADKAFEKNLAQTKQLAEVHNTKVKESFFGDSKNDKTIMYAIGGVGVLGVVLMLGSN